MLTWCFSAMLVVSAQEPAKLAPQGAGAKDAGAELKAHLAKVPTSGTYAFESTVESDAPSFGGRGGGAGGAPGGGAPGGGAPGGGDAGRGGPRVVAGTVDIGKSSELKQGDTLAYRSGTKLVYKKGDAWEVWAPPDFGGAGGAPGGGRGGGAGGPPAGGAPGGGFDRSRFAMMGVAYMVLPHEHLAGLDTKLTNVKESEANGKVTFTGTLTDAAADELSGSKRMREQFGGAGGPPGGAPAGGNAAGAPPAPKSSGTLSITFAADGSVEQAVIETASSGPRGEMKRKQTVTFKDWGKAKVEVPKEAAAKLTG